MLKHGYKDGTNAAQMRKRRNTSEDPELIIAKVSKTRSFEYMSEHVSGDTFALIHVWVTVNSGCIL